MKKRNKNEHFVSQVLLRRFTVKGHLQSYDVASGVWKPKGTRTVFAFKGWNQLLVDGEADNTLEEEFCRTEKNLPKTFHALEQALANSSKELPLPAYENLCKYCAFLWYMSPFAKAKCLIDLLEQLNLDLEKGNDKLLLELGCPPEIIPALREARSRGERFILNSPDILQLVYRFQIAKSCADQFSMFYNSAQWSICASPLEFPISDIALVQLHHPHEKATFYFLPIAPQILVKAKISMGYQTNDHRPCIKTETIPMNQAEYLFGAICLSAVNELVSSRIIPDIQAVRTRARERINFPTIVEPKQYASVGLKEPGPRIEFRMAPAAEWVKFVHSFLLPPAPPSPMLEVNNFAE